MIGDAWSAKRRAEGLSRRVLALAAAVTVALIGAANAQAACIVQTPAE